MKDLTLSFVGVVAIALVLGLVFHWVYPLVDLTGELAGLFVFAALVLKLVGTRLWALRRPPPAADAKAGK